MTTIPDPILITGATGGLGRLAVEMLSLQNQPVIATGRNQKILHQLATLPHVKTITTEHVKQVASTLSQIKTPLQAIWHCAALSAPSGHYEAFELANLELTKQVLTVAHRLGVPKFIHVSTPAIYFDFQHRYNVKESEIAYANYNTPVLNSTPIPNYLEVCANALPLKFSSHYAYTKFLAECAVQAYSMQYPSHVAIIRPRAIIGPYDNVLLPKILEAQTKYGKIPLPRQGSTITSPTPATSVIEAMQFLTQSTFVNPAHHFDIFNLSGQEPLTLAQILQILQKESGQAFNIKNIYYPVVQHIVKLYETLTPADTQKICSYSLGVLNYDMTLNMDKLTQLGFKPSTDTTTCLQQLALKLRS